MVNIRRLFNNAPDYVVESGTEGVSKTFVVDPDIAYPMLLGELKGLLHGGDESVTQYALEVARRCFTEDLKRMAKCPIMIRILPKEKKWALKNFPPGPGAEKGAQNFRLYYAMIRPQGT